MSLSIVFEKNRKNL